MEFLTVSLGRRHRQILLVQLQLELFKRSLVLRQRFFFHLYSKATKGNPPPGEIREDTFCCLKSKAAKDASRWNLS